jgi:hypothetical protein
VDPSCTKLRIDTRPAATIFPASVNALDNRVKLLKLSVEPNDKLDSTDNFELSLAADLIETADATQAVYRIDIL